MFRRRYRDFNPRTPWGVRLLLSKVLLFELQISIHAPRGGCDRRRDREYEQRPHFNPRTPWGVRRMGWDNITSNIQFQSTHPVGGATPVELYT